MFIQSPKLRSHPLSSQIKSFKKKKTYLKEIHDRAVIIPLLYFMFVDMCRTLLLNHVKRCVDMGGEGRE